jgi:mono/diheme cytochrome c family protein
MPAPGAPVVQSFFAKRSDDMTGSRRVKDSLWQGQSLKIFGALTFLFLLNPSHAPAQQVKQPWKAPASADAVQNPVKPTPAGLKDAQTLYQKNCVICHGPKGASNGAAAGSLPQKPANFTDAKMMQKATDGELFWKMTTGRAPMPSWQDKLTDTQRWELVNYLRKLTQEGKYKFLGNAS